MLCFSHPGIAVLLGGSAFDYTKNPPRAPHVELAVAVSEALYELLNGCTDVQLPDADMVDAEEIVRMVEVQDTAHVDGDVFNLHVLNLPAFATACLAVVMQKAENGVADLEPRGEELLVLFRVPDLIRIFERTLECTLPVGPEIIDRNDIRLFGYTPALFSGKGLFCHGDSVLVYDNPHAFVSIVEDGVLLAGGLTDTLKLRVPVSEGTDVMVAGRAGTHEVPVIPVPAGLPLGEVRKIAVPLYELMDFIMMSLVIGGSVEGFEYFTVHSCFKRI